MIVANIQKLCKSRDLTFAEVERITGIGNGVIARWDKASPRVENLKKVADYFGVTIDSIVTGKEAQNGSQSNPAGLPAQHCDPAQ